MSEIIKDDSKGLSYTLAFADAKGNPANPPAGVAPAWTVSDPAILAVAAAADGMSAIVTPTGALGTALVNVNIPAAGDGSFPAMSGSDCVQVAAEVAAAIKLSAMPVS